MLRQDLLGPVGQPVRSRGHHHCLPGRAIPLLEPLQGPGTPGPGRRRGRLRHGKRKRRRHCGPLHRRSQGNYVVIEPRQIGEIIIN